MDWSVSAMLTQVFPLLRFWTSPFSVFLRNCRFVVWFSSLTKKQDVSENTSRKTVKKECDEDDITRFPILVWRPVRKFRDGLGFEPYEVSSTINLPNTTSCSERNHWQPVAGSGSFKSSRYKAKISCKIQDQGLLWNQKETCGSQFDAHLSVSKSFHKQILFRFYFCSFWVVNATNVKSNSQKGNKYLVSCHDQLMKRSTVTL